MSLKGAFTKQIAKQKRLYKIIFWKPWRKKVGNRELTISFKDPIFHVCSLVVVALYWSFFPFIKLCRKKKQAKKLTKFALSSTQIMASKWSLVSSKWFKRFNCIPPWETYCRVPYSWAAKQTTGSGLAQSVSSEMNAAL